MRNRQIKIQYALCAISFVSTMAYGQPDYPRHYHEAQVVTADLDNFITSFLRLDAESDSTEILRQGYFGKASVGLKEYIQRHGLTVEMMLKAIHNYPDSYKSLVVYRKLTDKLEIDYRNALKTYQALIPNIMYPPTYLLVGAHRGIAQASQPGQLVTIERSVPNTEKILSTMIHELTHFQQALSLGFKEYSSTYGKENNMLDLVLREGVAEFFTYYLVLRNTKSYSRLTYVNERLIELKARFKKDLGKQDAKYWMWDSINQDERPILIGYTMGYKICQAYYEKAVDKAQAIKDILTIRNPDEFLLRSGFFKN